jgi:DNA-binding LacI/PurR family transcriptional regulator
VAKTVREIGRLAGFSSATVSRALNSSSLVSPQTHAAILRVAKEARYVPRSQSGKTKRFNGMDQNAGMVELVLHRHTPTESLSFDGLGLAVGPLSHFADSDDAFSKQNRLSHSFYRRIVDGAGEELSRWGHRAVLQLNDNLTSPTLLRHINLPDRAGVLLIGEYSPDLGSFVERCQRPLVLVDFIHDRAVGVSTDNLSGITQAFDHLHDLGHRKIGFVGRSTDIPAFEERFAAFRLKMADAGLPLEPHWVYQGPNHIEMTAAGVRQILQSTNGPTAFLCSNDCYALGVIRAATTLEMKCPHDLSVVGFDDEEAASLVTPPLTTVRVPVTDIGRQAVRQLMIQMRCNDTQSMRGYQVRLLPSLIVRQSTAAVRN